MKNETKKLLIGLGLGCAIGSLGLLLGIGIYGCASKPVTTTPIVNRINNLPKKLNDVQNADGGNNYFVGPYIGVYRDTFYFGGYGATSLSSTNVGNDYVTYRVSTPSSGYYWVDTHGLPGFTSFSIWLGDGDNGNPSSMNVFSLGYNLDKGSAFANGFWCFIPNGFPYLYYTHYNPGLTPDRDYFIRLYKMEEIKPYRTFVLPSLWYPWEVSNGVGNDKGSPLFLPRDGDSRFSIPSGEENSLHVVNIDVPLSKFMFSYVTSTGTQYGVADKMRFRFRSWHNGNIGYWKNGEWVGADIPSGYWLLYQVDYIEAYNADSSQNGSAYNAWSMPEEYPSPVNGKTCYKYLESGFQYGGFRQIGMLYDDGQVYAPLGNGQYMTATQWASWLSQQDISGFLPAAVDDITGGVDVFGLISDTFYVVMPILAIEILPGFTLGLLFLLPIVASIIVIVFKAIKK